VYKGKSIKFHGVTELNQFARQSLGLSLSLIIFSSLHITLHVFIIVVITVIIACMCLI